MVVRCASVPSCGSKDFGLCRGRLVGFFVFLAGMRPTFVLSGSLGTWYYLFILSTYSRLYSVGGWRRFDQFPTRGW